MPPPHELAFDLMQLGADPLREGDPAQPGAPVPGLPADVRKAQEIERLWLAQAACLPPPGGVPPELDQPRLALVQIQAELREPLPQICQEPLRVGVMLKTRDEVVREPHEDHIAVRVAAPPPLGPQVEAVVELDVPQQRRRPCPLRRPPPGPRPFPVPNDSSLQPPAERAHHALVPDPLLPALLPTA